MSGIQAGIEAEPDEAKRGMAKGALAAAQQAYRLRRDGQPVPDEIASVVERAQPLFALLRSKVGLDRVRLGITSTAPCRPEVHEFWAALGVPLYEVWGMSELTGPATAVPIDDHRAPSIGKPLPGVEVRLGDDGEILVRGGNVMVGYYREPAKTADTIDKDGWVHSGDIGKLGADGHFRIVDRKKELIITSSGKNISPANLEAVAKSTPTTTPSTERTTDQRLGSFAPMTASVKSLVASRLRGSRRRSASLASCSTTRGSMLSL